MARGSGQKLKILCLLKILREESDEEHQLTTGDLQEALARYGLNVERKTIYDDIEALQSWGYDIVCQRRHSNQYYWGEREFQTAELKLLADAVSSAKFISEKKSRTVVKKLEGFLSRHEAGALNRQLYVQGRSKSDNEGIYYNVDRLHHAINMNSSISCGYYEWVIDRSDAKHYKRRLRYGGKRYILSPWSLLWDHENYYLLAYDHRAGQMRHYRTDKLENVVLREEKRLGAEEFEKIDIAQYTKAVFGMFGGAEAFITLEFKNRLVGVVLDRFGREVVVNPVGEDKFRVSVKAAVSPQFYAWVFGFGREVKIISPQWVVTEMAEKAQEIMEAYKE